MLDDLAKLNQMKLEETGDPEIVHPHRPVRTGLPDANLGPRTARRVAGTAAGLRSVRSRRPQAGHVRGQLPAGPPAGRTRRALHATVPSRLGPAHQPAQPDRRASASDTDQPAAALVKDLKQRGLLDDTLVVWGGEFGRTVYCQGKLTRRRLRPGPSSALLHGLAGWRRQSRPASATARRTSSATTSSSDPVHVHDLHATLLHCLGIDHTRLTFKFQGRHYRLTDVHGEVVKEILA